MPPQPRTTRRPRRSSVERRADVLAAAIIEFGTYGMHGTTGAAIAERADITQPHLFHLFGSKRNLFLETVEYGFDRLMEAMAAALDHAPGNLEGLEALDYSYAIGLRNYMELMTQLQVWAACSDDEVRVIARRRFLEFYRWVAEATGASEAEVRSFCAYQFLRNVLAALKLDEVAGEDKTAAALAEFDDFWPQDMAAIAAKGFTPASRPSAKRTKRRTKKTGSARKKAAAPAKS